jgi:hypothetical protein
MSPLFNRLFTRFLAAVVLLTYHRKLSLVD